MKKLLTIMLMISALFAFAACGGDEQNEPNDSLAGTIWTKAYNGELLVLEFADGSNVEFYGADQNLNIFGKTYRGTYTKSGDVVAFNLTGSHYIQIKFKRGFINGNSMDIDCDVDRVIIGDEQWNPETLTFRKH